MYERPLSRDKRPYYLLQRSLKNTLRKTPVYTSRKVTTTDCHLQDPAQHPFVNCHSL